MKTETTYITCDMCGAIDASELRFSTHGGNYAIDLCETDMAVYENLIRSYVEKAHKVKPAPLSIRRDKPKAKAATNGEVVEMPKSRRHRGKVDNG